MPGIVKVKVIEGKNLPVMDRSADTTDAYVELKLGNITYKTEVCRKSLNPKWNSEWYRFEMDDAELQDEPLQVRLMDHDTYSANDMIGKVYFNLNPLLLTSSIENRDVFKSNHASSPGSGCISGWFPVYDTIHGLRGEINMIIKLELFSDLNKFRQSSCGVHILSSGIIPHGYYTENIFGFVEELVVEDDPEYQWIEKIRTPRASNEARQAMFYKMSGELQRKIGLKVIESGGNAIIGYRQCFDLESETGGVVVRGIGTAVKLNRYKKMEYLPCNSFKFNIPYLTVTSVHGDTPSDACSISSVSESLQSDLAPDRWSLRSFTSQTSGNSRYTSIETLLDQSNRISAERKSSKLLKVARCFTSSKIRRKFSRRSKQKSYLASRKFSVIEEGKQKTKIESEAIDEMIHESLRIPKFRMGNVGVFEEEKVCCQIYENCDCTRGKYFNLSDLEANAKIEYDCPFNIDRNITEMTDYNQFHDGYSDYKKPNNKVELDFVVSDSDQCGEVSSSVCNNGIQEVENASSNIGLIGSSNIAALENADMSCRLELPSKNVNDDGLKRCLTPPVSEMTPYSMSSPPIFDYRPTINAPLLQENVRNTKLFKFEQSFLQKLRRSHVSNYFSLSNSPEIKKLVAINQKHKSHVTHDVISVSSEQYEVKEKTENNMQRKTSVSETECTPRTELSLTRVINLPYVNNNKPYDDSYLFTNKNCDIEITAADGNYNTREALTTGFVMHANNSDRNFSDGDRDGEEESTDVKKETTVEPLVKNRPSLTDINVATVKCSECNKELLNPTEIEPTVSSTETTDCGGFNIIHKENIELMEYPFLTLTTYPEDFILHLGGTVSARSVKLLARVSNIEEPETRDAWWTELRIEIKSHMRALACNVVLNYTENTSICDEICVLSANGTAALVKIYDGSSVNNEDPSKYALSRITDDEDETEDKIITDKTMPEETNCSIFHIPYRKSSLPFPVKIKSCGMCKKGFVADVIFVTIEPLDKMPIIGQASFVHAFVYRLKRDCKSELNAREVSDGLPFLEYELNRQLINKLRIKGMNAIFSLNVQVSVGEKMISTYATGTAVLLSALPTPPEITLLATGRSFNQHPMSRKKLNDFRKLVEDTIKKNKVHYQLAAGTENTRKSSLQSVNAEEQYSDIDYFAGSKRTYVIEVDDEDDLEVIAQLIDPNPPQGFLVSATDKIISGSLPYIAKKNIQLFAQVYRYRIPSNTPPSSFNKVFYRIFQALYMKVHNRIPCSLNKVSFKIDIPEPDELQIRVVGMALALKESEKMLDSISTSCSSVSELGDDVVVNIDNEKDADLINTLNTMTPRKHVKKRNDIMANEVHITSLSYIPGATINFYLGNLNFVFIRESTMVKEQTGCVNTFVNNLLSDITCIVKSHAVGIGGNAVVNFFLNECLLVTHSHKNQGQCLINVGGDVVRYVSKVPKDHL